MTEPLLSVGLAEWIAGHLPLYVCSLLCDPDPGPDAAAALSGDGLREVTAQGGPVPSGGHDGVLLYDYASSSEELQQVWTAAGRAISENGAVFFLWHADAPHDVRASLVYLAGLCDLRTYHYWESPPQPDGVPRTLFMLVRSGYNAFAHARLLAMAHKPAKVHAVLNLVPREQLDDPAAKASFLLARIESVVQGDTLLDGDGRTLERFNQVQLLFFEATLCGGVQHGAYHAYAELWKRVGNRPMAARVLRSVQAVAPSDETASLLADLPPGSDPGPPREVPPAWRPGTEPPSILMITDDRPNFGMDILYEGLHRLLGPEKIVEYPYKETLHGVVSEKLRQYPCQFDLEGPRLSLDDVCDALRAGRFDVVLFGDVERLHGEADMRRVREAAGNIPLFVVDQMDESSDLEPRTLAYLGIDRCAGYVKRETLAGARYHSKPIPVPFAYAESNLPAPDTVRFDRQETVFWAGKGLYGLRMLHMEALRRFTDINRVLSPEDYKEALLRSRIGVDLAGVGFDTVRYWEVPAHGCMLFAERKPIVIPNDFRDGVEAVFFDDVADMTRKLGHLLGHPGEVRAVAEAGYRHFLGNHTSTARARQLLGYIGQRLGWQA
jgi:hypothetical protein